MVGALIIGTLHLNAGNTDFGMEYTTEMQTDFRKKVNWVNLLRTDFTYSPVRNISFSMATVSISETTADGLMDDRLTFSNIEEENTPLAPAVIGLEWKNGASALFIGVRNLNEDYFTSPVTSLFTNSSCGIFPTLSVNYPLANYPCASLGIDYKLSLDKIDFDVSVYNGKGYKNFWGRDNVFRFCPSSDGVIGVTSLNYTNDVGCYYMGGAVCSSVSVSDVEGTEQLPEQKKENKVNGVLWGYAERKLSDKVYLLLQASGSLYKDAECKNYFGMGALAELGKKVEAGAFVGYATFSTEYEVASELTCKIQLRKNLYVQPALHYVHNGHFSGVAGLFRMGWSI